MPPARNGQRHLYVIQQIKRLILLVLDRGLGGGEAGDGDAEGAAGDVGQADLVAECDGRRIAALLAADAELDVRAGLAAELRCHLDEAADACLVELGERIGLVDLAGIAGLAKLGKHFSFHTARHTNATLLIYLGAQITTVQKLLGHRNVKTTQGYGEIFSGTIVNDLKKCKFFKFRKYSNNVIKKG